MTEPKIHIHSKILIYKKKAEFRDDITRPTLEEAIELFKEFFDNENQTSFQFYKDGRQY